MSTSTTAAKHPLPKERYVIDSCATGIKANRSSVYVNLEYVVSVSPLADVIKF